MTLKFKRYTYHCPELLPVQNTEERIEAKVYQAAGFDPKDEEVWVGRLISDWEEHPTGALVLSGLTSSGHSFAVEC